MKFKKATLTAKDAKVREGILSKEKEFDGRAQAGGLALQVTERFRRYSLSFVRLRVLCG
jgi:hypothetical protein